MSDPCTQPLPDEFAEPLARAADRLGLFAGRILWYPDVPSTNDLAASLAEGGAPEGCLVVANAQSAGRGRHGRSWVSPAGAGLYVSAVLRPARTAVPMLTIAAGVAVAEGIRAATGLSPHLKWPNDVYAGDRKVAGVLAEASSTVAAAVPATPVEAGLQVRLPGIPYVVLGIGINVMPAAYPPDVAVRATSLEAELGRVVDRGLLLAECLSALARRYADLHEGLTAGVLDAWRARAAPTLGRRVGWDAAGTRLEGVAEDIDAAGGLVVRTRTGRITVTSGEMIWL